MESIIVLLVLVFLLHTEGFNDFPVKSFCFNAQHLLCVANSTNFTEIKGSVDVSSDLEFYIYPFSEKQTAILYVSPTE